VWLAVLAAGAPLASARAQSAPPFEVVPNPSATPHPHRAAWLTAFAGVGFIAVSFPLAHEADHRYAQYLAETDVALIDERYDATTRMDRLATATLLTGEALLVTSVWLRFVHAPRETNRLSFAVEPSRCAVSLRF
jgi:hypothetical protein